MSKAFPAPSVLLSLPVDPRLQVPSVRRTIGRPMHDHNAVDGTTIKKTVQSYLAMN